VRLCLDIMQSCHSPGRHFLHDSAAAPVLHALQVAMHRSNLWQLYCTLKEVAGNQDVSGNAVVQKDLTFAK
jgi:hypothetical protein